MTAASDLSASIPPFFTELSKILAGEIDCSQQTLVEHSTDHGSYQIRPQAVIYPKHTGDIKNIIIFSREYSMPLTVCGGQSAGSGGALGEGIIIDMTRHFNRIRHVNMIEHTVTVDAGVTVAQLSEKLRVWNMEIPMLKEEDTSGTIGGLLATKSATSSTFHHGTIREWVEEVTLVVDTGEEHHIKDGITPSGRLLAIYQAVFPFLTEHGPILRASKPENADDASGYSLWGTSIGPRQLLDQIVGSEGTLGIITSTTLRVSPQKPYSITLALSIPTQEILASCISILKHHKTDSIFMYDEMFTHLSYKAYPTLLLGEADSPYHLLITLYDGDDKKLKSKTAHLIKALPIPEGCITKSTIKTMMECQKYSFLDTIVHTYTNGTQLAIPIANGIIVSHEEYPHLLREIQDYMDALGKMYMVTGYAGSGHISLTALFDPKSLLYETNIIACIHDIYTLVKKYKGGISATGGDGYSKTPYLPMLYSEAMMTIFKKIKEMWDPLLVFNPSKKGELASKTLEKYLRKS